MAVVDQHVPFYKLPSGLPAPGEACGRIKPGDILIGLNHRDVRSESFEATVEALRNAETGVVTLRFKSPAYLPLIDIDTSDATDDLADRLRSLEALAETLTADLEREKKCRALADKKAHLYREEVLRLSQENVDLRVAVARAGTAQRTSDEFLACTQLML
ncbi:prephenate dehydratase [Achlya hypogyna]|uniref:Prephenate dehydratase n=1 Tax=Achlya hypogyna TaxID=1202772 RepID=A0A1V9ZH37_ACHHY|nr:prephenate dehydratase [Achlya hypogyna]